MQLKEVRGQEDIDALLEQVAPEQKAVIANLNAELGDDTDAVTILRMNPETLGSNLPGGH